MNYADSPNQVDWREIVNGYLGDGRGDPVGPKTGQTIGSQDEPADMIAGIRPGRFHGLWEPLAVARQALGTPGSDRRRGPGRLAQLWDAILASSVIQTHFIGTRETVSKSRFTHKTRDVLVDPRNRIGLPWIALSMAVRIALRADNKLRELLDEHRTPSTSRDELSTLGDQLVADFVAEDWQEAFSLLMHRHEQPRAAHTNDGQGNGANAALDPSGPDGLVEITQRLKSRIDSLESTLSQRSFLSPQSASSDLTELVSDVLAGVVRRLVGASESPEGDGLRDMSLPDVEIFASYSSTDRRIVAQLLKFYQVVDTRVFFDQQSIGPGADWERAIGQGIASCDAVLVFWCEHSAASSWVEEEVRMAIDQGKRLVPVLLDDEPLREELERYQWIDLRQLTTHPGRDTNHPSWLDTGVLDTELVQKFSKAVAEVVGSSAPRNSLKRSHLVGSIMQSASLTGVDLGGAELAESDLRNSVLRNCDLRGANLSGCRLDGADLHGALRDEDDAPIPGWILDTEADQRWGRLRADRGVTAETALHPPSGFAYGDD